MAMCWGVRPGVGVDIRERVIQGPAAGFDKPKGGIADPDLHPAGRDEQSFSFSCSYSFSHKESINNRRENEKENENELDTGRSRC